jgi:hypothetical protein
MTLTVRDLTAGYRSADWGRNGYLGERRSALSADGYNLSRWWRPGYAEKLVARADERILAVANGQGWTAEELFDWTNSYPGRYYGMAWFGDDLKPAELEARIAPYLCRVPAEEPPLRSPGRRRGWRRKVYLSDVWDLGRGRKPGVSFEHLKRVIFVRLNATGWPASKRDVRDLVDALARAGDEERFDRLWKLIYDLAAEDRVWIDLVSPIPAEAAAA